MPDIAFFLINFKRRFHAFAKNLKPLHNYVARYLRGWCFLKNDANAVNAETAQLHLRIIDVPNKEPY